MNLDLSLAQSFPSLLGPTTAFAGLADRLAGQDVGATPPKAGIATIPPPRTLAETGPRSSLAPPMAPDTPAIAPPEHGSSASKSLQGTGASMNGPTAKLAYIAALKLEMASSQTNGAAGDKKSILQMAGTKV